MASSPSSPGSPTGTLTRESSKKDSGKLGWVGTLTRRKKGQEGKFSEHRNVLNYLVKVVTDRCERSIEDV